MTPRPSTATDGEKTCARTRATVTRRDQRRPPSRDVTISIRPSWSDLLSGTVTTSSLPGPAAVNANGSARNGSSELGSWGPNAGKLTALTGADQVRPRSVERTATASHEPRASFRRRRSLTWTTVKTSTNEPSGSTAGLPSIGTVDWAGSDTRWGGAHVRPPSTVSEK